MVIRDDALVRYLQVPLDSDFDRLFRAARIPLWILASRNLVRVSMMVRSVSRPHRLRLLVGVGPRCSSPTRALFHEAQLRRRDALDEGKTTSAPLTVW